MDFGEQRCEEGLVVHLTSILLWHSRHLWVCAQDHRLDSEEACRAIHRFTCKVGGRPRTLVIDQDSVFVTDEIYGEVSGTATFKDFLTEQDLRPWVCGKGDPESKGAMENTVKYVRSSYFSARRIASIEEAWRTPPAWNRRANRRTHQGTYKIPQVEFEDRERAAPRPMLPSFYEAAPPGLKEVSIDSQPYVPCRSARHPVPWDMCHAKACHRAIGPKPHTCDGRRRHVCVHDISPVKGPFRRLEGHKRHPASDWPGIAERMRVKWNRTDSRHLVNGSEREDQARHLGRQLGAAGRYLDERKPSRALVAEATGICCRDLRYRHAHLKAVFDLAGARHAGGGAPNAVTADATTANEAEGRGMESHRRAFEERCAL